MSDLCRKKTVIALGFFDGVHRGHAQLIQAAKRRAAVSGAESAVLSFDKSPMSVVREKTIPLITDTRLKTALIKELFAVDKVIIHPFDQRIMTLPWENFIDSLIHGHGAVGLVIGHDFSCGYKGLGNAGNIPEYCLKKGLTCDVIPEFTLESQTVSSTLIRSLIAQGDISRANNFLGHPYVIEGDVVAGRGQGKSLGAPTLNLSLEQGLQLPPCGVYATRVLVDDMRLPAVTNIGYCPTFGTNGDISVESHIMDFSGDLYGKRARVEFFEFIRPERKFSDTRELSREIQANAAYAKKVIMSLKD